MNETRILITETAERIFRDLATKDVVDEAEKGTWPQELWSALEESGLTLAAIPEEHGGSGGDLGDTMAVLYQAGRYAAPVPLAETYLAGGILSASGMDVPPGPLTIAYSTEAPLTFLQGQSGGGTLSGTAFRVPYAASVEHIVALVSDNATRRIALIDPQSCAITEGRNLAGEPRHTVCFDKVQLTEENTRPAPPGFNVVALLPMGALCRAVQMAGALETVLALTIEHANVRIQFGRPIGSFQAVRQQIAVLAGHVAAANRAAQGATTAAEAGDGATEIAVAKARVGEAAGTVAAIAHQVHGAIGMTHEHALHQYTRRLWSWRDDFGSEQYWQEILGKQIVAQPPENLWPFLTGT